MTDNSIKPTVTLKPLPDRDLGIRLPDPSFAEVFANQTYKYIGPLGNAIADMWNTFGVRQEGEKRDLGFNVKDFIESKNISLNSPQGKYILSYGFNPERAQEAYEKTVDDQINQQLIEQGGFLKQFLTDPVLIAELATLGGGYALVKKMAKQRYGKLFGDAFISTDDIARVRRRNILDKNEKLRKEIEKVKTDALEEDPLFEPFEEVIKEKVTAKNFKAALDAKLAETMAMKGFKIANQEALFFEGSANVIMLANDLSGQEEADRAIINALSRQAVAQGVSSVLGFGAGAVVDKLRRPQAASVEKSFLETMKNFEELSKGVDANPRGTLKDDFLMNELKDDDLLFQGEWWTDSIFYKALPTPVKAIMGNKSLAPNSVKLRFMRLVNDAGVLFKLNQRGAGFGTSVFQEAGRLSGKWGNTYNQIHELWGEASNSGNYTIADMQISDTIETIQKLRGKESLTFEDFGQHIVDLYIHNKTPNTDIEKKAVQVLRSYFEEWDKLLNDVGLLRGTASLVARKTKVERDLAGQISVFDDILNRNLMYLENNIIRRREKLAQYDRDFPTKGLTDKQLKARPKIQEELDEFSKAYEVAQRVRTLEDARKYIDNIKLTQPQKETVLGKAQTIEEMAERLDNLKSYLDGTAVDKGLKENFFPRYFDKRKILANREAFEQKLIDHYSRNPFIWDWDDKTKRYIQIRLEIDEASVKRRAKKTTDSILDMVDEDGFADGYFGKGRSKHLIHRQLDIPNSELAEFMVTDLKQVIIAYNEKVAPKVAFAQKFRTTRGLPATLDDIIQKNTKEMSDKNIPQKEIDRINKEFIGAYDRIVGRVLTKPDSLSTRTAQWLQAATQWTYLGGAGIAAIADFANIFLDHEMKTIFKGLVSLAQDNSIVVAKRELQKAGDAFEIIGGSYHMKFVESLTSNPFRNGLSDKVNDAFYKFNLLGQMTMTAKTMEGMFRSHTIIEMSRKLANDKKLTKFEKNFLGRYNINKSKAKAIASQPTETTKNGFILANTDAWDNEIALETFQNALRSGTMNRIIMGTPADKPLVMSGKTYMPMHLAKEFGLTESKRVKGYAELEHPFLALPFTFYTYTVGALNKVTTNYAQGGVRGANMAIHSAIAMFFGYNIVKFRTPDYAWDEMDIEDKVLRSFDFSGLAALHSDMFYRSLEMGMAFDIENPTPFQPKFVEDPDALGGVVSVFGAPADYSYGFVKVLKDFASGQYGDATEQTVKQIPLIWNMFLKPYTNRLKNALGDFAEGFE